MNRTKMRNGATRWVAPVALVCVIVTGATATAMTEKHDGEKQAGEKQTSWVTVKPSTHLIAEHQVTMWIGSVSVNRAVIQITRPPSDATRGIPGTWDFITGAALKSGRQNAHATMTKSRLADGTLALTLVFNAPREVGRSVPKVDTKGKTCFFDVRWPKPPVP